MRFRSSILRFSRLVMQTYGLPVEQLIAVITAKDRFSVRLRAAALRNLVADAPLAVTHGRPFGQRRRLVRKHYGV